MRRPRPLLPPLLAGALLLAAAGCAPLRGRPAAPPPPPGWSAELPELLPAIDACVRRAGPSARGVTQAWAMAADIAGVRLLRGDGSRIDCFAARTDGRVLLLQPVRVASRHEDESTPLYTPPGRDPPRDGCVTTLPARVDARQVGWLSYPVCDQGDPPRQPPEGLAPIPPSV